VIVSPVTYSQEEELQIINKKSDANFKSTSWSDADLDDIKQTIKTHYHRVQNSVCPYCQQKLNTVHGRNWDIEHIVPRSHEKNFMFEPLNLCMSCLDCNKEKSNKKITSSGAKKKYPTDTSLYFIVHPHFDDYDEHILKVKVGFFYVPKKAKGRKTIEVCGLNRFYKFAGFNEDVNNDNRIATLADLLLKTSDREYKNELRTEIAALAIQGAAQ
jgi:uncharacterized protein (TIGR02646 family)